MKVYIELINNDSEFGQISCTKISPKPFSKNCWEVDLNDTVITNFELYDFICENKKSDRIRPYNVVIPERDYCYNPKTKDYKYEDEISDEEDDDYSIQGYRCTKYVNGNVSKIYFSEQVPEWVDCDF